jgi:hypothetical protein
MVVFKHIFFNLTKIISAEIKIYKIGVTQSVIITTTWNERGNSVGFLPHQILGITVHDVTHSIQVASVVFAVVAISKDYARQHFYELFGKPEIPGKGNLRAILNFTPGSQGGNLSPRGNVHPFVHSQG